MALDSQTAHEGSTLSVRLVRCRSHESACGPIEHAAAHQVVLPLRGVFVKHHGSRERVVADACHAIFFNADEPYRVSHPVDGGDDCLAIELAQDTLRDLLSTLDPRAADCSGAVFRRRSAQLDARLIAARRIFWHRLERRISPTLEVEETGLTLFVAAMRSATMSDSPRHAQGLRTRSRHQETVESTRIALASQPARSWTLHALARRVHSSPFHLARMFRELTGLPLHRFHLRARLAVALDEVLDSSLDLTTIGVQLGFASHSHFTAAFRRTFGLTPSTLRREANVRQVAELSKILTAR